jgi:ATP-dependent Lon protease
MTGEITLRGRVLPIGGLKEKVLAAHRGGIKTVVIPKENAKDIVEIAPQILKGVQLVQADNVDEVLRHALVLDDPDAFFKPKPARKDLDFLREADKDEPDTPDDDEPRVSPNLS